MITVVDQARPWLMPSRTFATTTQPQSGAQMSRSGTGSPNSQPATRTGLRPNRSASAPAARLVSALVMPKATMNDRIDGERRSSPKISVAMSGRTVRSWPTIPPTRPLTPTSRRELARVLSQAESKRRDRNRGHGPSMAIAYAAAIPRQARGSPPPGLTFRTTPASWRNLENAGILAPGEFEAEKDDLLARM